MMREKNIDVSKEAVDGSVGVVSVINIETVTPTMATPVINPANVLWSRVPFKPSLKQLLRAFVNAVMASRFLALTTRDRHS